jgi:hypothetical protein
MSKALSWQSSRVPFDTQAIPTIRFVEVMERYARRYGHDPSKVFEFLRGQDYSHELVVNGQRRESQGSLAEDLQLTTNFLFSAAD